MTIDHAVIPLFVLVVLALLMAAIGKPWLAAIIGGIAFVLTLISLIYLTK